MGNGTELGRVRGLGSAHSGTHHWLVQRYTAVGNLIVVQRVKWKSPSSSVSETTPQSEDWSTRHRRLAT